MLDDGEEEEMESVHKMKSLEIFLKTQHGEELWIHLIQ